MTNYTQSTPFAEYMAPKHNETANNFLSLLQLWRHRYRSRQQLKTLTSEHLNDIGISAQQALIESQKPFWVG